MRRALCTAAKFAKIKENADPNLQSTISNLLRVRKKIPDALYVGSKAAAQRLISELEPRLDRSRPLLEINPGFGFFTRELLNLDLPKINLFESSKEYLPYLEQLKTAFPDRIEYKITDFFTIWKSNLLDKLDDGERIDIMFENIRPKPWESGLSLTVVGCMPTLKFLQHLNMAMIFQETITKIGRVEFYLLTVPKNYFAYSKDEKSKIFYSYKPNPVLFNILFDHEIVAKMPRSDYLPIQSSTLDTVRGKNKIEVIEKEKQYTYLIRICGKEKYPVKIEHLPLLWYFCKHHLRTKENRVIPKLEEWIPGCGIWIITGQDPPGTNTELSPDENDAPLPHITIFTQFHDLTPQETLTLFKRFISWPEFEQSPFKEVLDNHLSKSISSYDADVKIDIEQDDEPHEHE